MNFNLPKIKALFSIAGILFLTAGVLAGSLILQSKQGINEKAAGATILSISPHSQELHKNDDVTFYVTMDTGTNNVIGADILLKFNPSVLLVDSIERGSGINEFSNVVTNEIKNSLGTINYTAFTLDKNLAVKGTNVEVLKVNAKVKDDSVPGVYQITFDSTTAISATSESSSVLTNTNPGLMTVLNPTPVPTAIPTDSPGEANSCGGTCGSNSNCKANLYCYQGYCRNPSCGWSTDCNCSATPSPSPVPTNKPAATNSGKGGSTSATNSPTTKPEVTASPVAVKTVASSPTPTANSFWQNIFNNNAGPTPTVSPTIEPVSLPESKSDSMLPWIIGSLVAVGVTLVIIAIGILKHDGVHKPKPPVIEI